MVTNNKRRREGGPPRRHRQLQGMWSCWHEGDKKREQGLALLKKTEEILGSKNNNKTKIATTTGGDYFDSGGPPEHNAQRRTKCTYAVRATTVAFRAKQRRRERAQECTVQKPHKVAQPKKGQTLQRGRCQNKGKMQCVSNIMHRINAETNM